MTATAVNSIHRILLAAGTAAMVSTAAVFSATVGAEESPTTASITLATSTSALPAPNGLHSEFCPFGKAHKHGKGCRFGSINDEDTKESAKVSTECASKALGASAAKKLLKRKRPKLDDVPTPSWLLVPRTTACAVFTSEPAR